jgi:hypothetical protein
MQTIRIKNSDLGFGYVVVERTERGSVEATYLVRDITGCSADVSNIHVNVRERKTGAHANWCLFINAESEVQL